jgi:hypothetical protein
MACDISNAYFNVKNQKVYPSMLRLKNRRQETVLARHICVYLTYHINQKNEEESTSDYGLKRTMYYHIEKRIANMLEMDKRFLNVVRNYKNRNNEINDKQLRALGFNITETYSHDQYFINKYTKGILGVECTYQNGKIISFDLTIKEKEYIPVTYYDLKTITEWFNNVKK